MAALENAYSRYPSADGRFAQLAGVRVTFDPSKPGLEGLTSTSSPSRVIEMVQVDSAGDAIDTIVSAGVLQGDPTRTFILATTISMRPVVMGMPRSLLLCKLRPRHWESNRF